MAQTTFNNGDSLAVARAAINSNADDVDLRVMTKVVVDSTLTSISQFLNGSVYELPANAYYFDENITWGSLRIDLNDQDGFYVFKSKNFTANTYTGTSPFIFTTATGVVCYLSETFFITPNATAVDLSNGNSLILDFPVFSGCQKCINVDNFSFFTVLTLAMVGNGDGCTVNDVGTTTMQLPQWSGGLDTGGNAFTFTGASSERLIIALPDSRPAASESFLNIAASWGGDADISGGVHDDTTGGAFYGDRDQDDVEILGRGIKNVEDSIASGSLYIAAGDETPTTINTQNVAELVAGTWTIAQDKRFTITTAGRVTYIGKEDMTFTSIAKHVVTPAGGINRDYSLCVLKNSTTDIIQSLTTVVADASNPKLAVQIFTVDMVTNDFLEHTITQTSTPLSDPTVSTSSWVLF